MTSEIEIRQNITDLVDLDDETLSYKARGMLLHLAATYAPDTQIAMENLWTKRDGEGRSALRTVLLELERHGYLRRGRGTAWVFRGDPTRWTA